MTGTVRRYGEDRQPTRRTGRAIGRPQHGWDAAHPSVAERAELLARAPTRLEAG